MYYFFVFDIECLKHTVAEFHPLTWFNDAYLVLYGTCSILGLWMVCKTSSHYANCSFFLIYFIFCTLLYLLTLSSSSSYVIFIQKIKKRKEKKRRTSAHSWPEGKTVRFIVLTVKYYSIYTRKAFNPWCRAVVMIKTLGSMEVGRRELLSPPWRWLFLFNGIP